MKLGRSNPERIHDVCVNPDQNYIASHSRTAIHRCMEEHAMASILCMDDETKNGRNSIRASYVRGWHC